MLLCTVAVVVVVVVIDAVIEELVVDSDVWAPGVVEVVDPAVPVFTVDVVVASDV
jgi:hypothetical protein